MNLPLDHEELPLESTNTSLRSLPNILEIVPMVAVLIGVFMKNDTITVISFSAWAFIYLALGWFIFKRKKYTFGSVLFAEITSVIIACGVMAIGFQIMNWTGKENMRIATLPMLTVGLIVNVIWYFNYKNNKQELGFSRKMMIRLAGLLALLLYYFN
ncbi:MAG: hypothetical protein R2825_22420 [Saprospiraceae bacterium]